MWLQTFAVLVLLIFYSASCFSTDIPDDSSTASASLASPSAPPPQAQMTMGSQPLAIYQQALNHLLGRNGVPRSAEKAASLFKILAEQNWSSAQHMLGNMYLRGKGVEKNDLLAYKWLSLASRNNLQLAQAIHEKRRQLYEKLQASLSYQSLNKVELWIAEWKPSTGKPQLN